MSVSYVSDHPYVYIDVDLTLIDIKNNLLPDVRERLAELQTKYALVAWSAGGARYAEQVLAFHNLTEYFLHIVGKPFIVIDDSPDTILSKARTVKISKHSWATLWESIFGKEVY